MKRDLGEHWCPNCGPIGTCRCAERRAAEKELTDRAALVERVARALVSQDSRDKGQEDLVWKVYVRDATVAVSLIRAEVLEEAARVAEFSFNREYQEGMPVTQEIAAAIRALKEK